MELPASGRRSVSRYVLLLFSLCIPIWIIGAMSDVPLFPGFKLFQAGLAMPMVASLLLTYLEHGWAGTAVLLRRTYDIGQIRPRVWFLPILLVFPSFGAINYWALHVTGADLPPPTFSLLSVLGYGTVFFMTYAEELGLSGYALDPLQERHSALSTGLMLGLGRRSVSRYVLLLFSLCIPIWIIGAMLCKPQNHRAV